MAIDVIEVGQFIDGDEDNDICKEIKGMFEGFNEMDSIERPLYFPAAIVIFDAINEL